MEILNTLISSFGSFGWTLVSFVVALSIIVAIHEYGHYIVGRWSGIHAEVFSIGFGKVLWSRTDKRGTVWQIAALPFGGYVKFLGDANAASFGGDTDVEGSLDDDKHAKNLSPAAQAHVNTLTSRNTMLGAPLWGRAATVAAGPIFNFILSFFVFSGLLLFQGQPITPLTVSSLPSFPDSIEQQLLPGDQVISVEGNALDYPDGFAAAIAGLPSQPSLAYEVVRYGETMTVQGPQPQPAFVQSITPRSAADDAGLKIGDVIVSMNGTAVYQFADMINEVNATGANPIELEVWRDGEMRIETLTPRLQAIPQPDGSMLDEPKLGIGNGGLFFDPATSSAGILESAGLAAKQVWFIIVQSLNGLKQMIIGNINTCNLSGPVGIAETAGSMASQGAVSFISLIAVLSTAVGLLNLFPIPVLDGGHLVFHAYEAVTGKMPSDSALRIFMAIGLAMIGTLMLFAIGNDLLFCP
ncbi:RIP metalloprotease RseP [Octadecabacter sp. 1_MG-2023]|uniref:RIP metalloprotease RseP n=1 Tax=unclassified Octadecabacter TaxID=196158 RepID=UPI001C094522|nr:MULTISPECIES: RIP metalloprotease RseP [unclassified Octadecabacter]MBU2993209.1 RIP metalloprotease RseP [Octadecabacter sp. B2R22]MDO6733338.1 RIP metalloprotease RseP [Octadecabacter sp. 1_MG-2023]